MNQRKKIVGGLLTATMGVLVAACGGGGNSSGGGTNALPTLITSSLIVDVNGDGKADVILGSQGDGYASPIVLINSGNGSSFTKSATAIPSQYKGINGAAVDIEAGDFNKDGKIDLLISTVDVTPTSFYGSSQIQLFLGNGNGTFTDATANITNNTIIGFWYDHLRVADYNGDGFLDFATTSTAGNAAGAIYLNDGTGHFAPASISVTTGGVASMVASFGSGDLWVGDINNDTKPDFFSPSCTCSFLNTSTAGGLSFTQVSTAATGGMQYGVLLDINGDGKLDMIGSADVSGSATTTVPVLAFQGDGLGGFTANNAFLSPQPGLVHGRQFLAADLNGDGKLDVLISDHGFDQNPFPGARNWLLINNGAGVLVDHTSTGLDLLPGYTHQSSIGDLNGDGNPDIILNNSSACNGTTLTCANEQRFWLNNGSGVFANYNPAIQ